MDRPRLLRRAARRGSLVAGAISKLAGASIVFGGGLVLAGVALYHSARSTD